jgi:hypothetical protein
MDGHAGPFSYALSLVNSNNSLQQNTSLMPNSNNQQQQPQQQNAFPTTTPSAGLFSNSHAAQSTAGASRTDQSAGPAFWQQGQIPFTPSRHPQITPLHQPSFTPNNQVPFTPANQMPFTPFGVDRHPSIFAQQQPNLFPQQQPQTQPVSNGSGQPQPTLDDLRFDMQRNRLENDFLYKLQQYHNMKNQN